MIRANRQIGRPGISGKWKQPPGTRLYRWTYSNTVSGMTGGSAFILRQDQFGNTRAVIKTITSPGAGFYTPSNTFVLLESLKAEQSSRAWSTPGASPRVEIRANDAGKGFNGDLLETDAAAESASCDPADRVIASIGAFKKFWGHNGTYNFGPEFYARTYFADRPTSSVSCSSSFTASFLILLPSNGVASTPVQVGTLTLLEET